MIKLFKKHRKSKLSDCDVREIAKMQMRIDYYEQCFLQLLELANGKEPGLVLEREDDLQFPLLEPLYRKITNLTESRRNEKSYRLAYESIFLEWASRIETGCKADIEQYCKESLYRNSIMKIDRFIDKNIKK